MDWYDIRVWKQLDFLFLKASNRFMHGLKIDSFKCWI